MIRAATPEEISMVAGKLSYSPSEGAKGVALLEQHCIRAMCVYDHWTPNSVNVHIYSAGPKYLFRPDFLRAVFEYPFEQGGKGLLIGITPADCSDSLAFSKWCGFREVYRVKDGWKIGVDLVVKELRKDECRWLEKKAA